jgi:hypothetical protein
MDIIKFVRYLSMKYFESFELRDDSQYWETDVVAVCLNRFNEFNMAINKLGEFLDSNSADDEDDLEGDEDDLDSPSSRMDEALMRKGGMGAGLN